MPLMTMIVVMGVRMGITVPMNGVVVMRMPMAMVVRMKVERFPATYPPHQHPYSYRKD
jgi:hypothetical protein